MEHEEFWAGEFGDEYLARNQVDYTTRLPFWSAMMLRTEPDIVLEVGCNKGHNLLAIQEAKPGTRTIGIDVNRAALLQAHLSGVDGVFHIPALIAGAMFPGVAGLTFTAGVLIHIPPSDLEAVMRSIIATSRRYVLAVEYEDVDEVEVVYRGHTDRLWRRPYGKLYQDLGLKLIDRGPAEGFDSCTWWLLTKEVE